jgi:leucyl-tRNA synthetase
MAVPAHDERDHAFAKHFGLEIKQVIEAPADWNILEKSFDSKDSRCINSDFLNGLHTKEAIKKVVEEIEKRNIGEGKINFRLRDAVFGRQRYWGEPIPIYYENGIPKAVDEKDLPVILPEVDKYLPTEDGEPPLARATNWKYTPHPQPLSKGEGSAFPLEATTMPGWAGSSWYFLRYMDPENKKEFASKEAINYWKDVDLYIGGSEHATGHLLYVRFWTKFLFDLGLIPVEEPAKKLINQGMIQGVSAIIHRITPIKMHSINMGFESGPLFDHAFFVSEEFKDDFDLIALAQYEESKNYPKHVLDVIKKIYQKEFNKKFDVSNSYLETKDYISFNETAVNCDISLVNSNNELNVDGFKNWRPEVKNSEFILSDDGKFYCSREVEKMSKSKYNVVSPDDIVTQHGADALRLYEMFLGPLELSKPWNTNGITGVSGFIRKLWRLYHQKRSNSPSPSEKGPGPGDEAFFVSDEAPTKPELKSLHKLIKKVTEDIERFSFNTSVSNFMICVNELTDLKCNKRAILQPLAVLVSPYAPHVAEELWEKLGHKESVTYAKWMEHKEEYLTEDSFAYPISVNGKTKFNLEIALGLSKDEIEKEVMTSEEVKKVLQGQPPKKVIIVPGRIVNIVV